jgi:hypothetical protein
MQGHQPDLRAIAVRDDDLVIAGQIGQSGRRDPHVGVLGLCRHRLATLQQGVPTEGHDDAHHACPIVATRTALIE